MTKKVRTVHVEPVQLHIYLLRLGAFEWEVPDELCQAGLIRRQPWSKAFRVHFPDLIIELLCRTFLAHAERSRLTGMGQLLQFAESSIRKSPCIYDKKLAKLSRNSE